MNGTLADLRQYLGLTTEMAAEWCSIPHDRYLRIEDEGTGMSNNEDVFRRLDPTEFRKQYEGRWEPPGPLTDAELERMERRHYKGNEDAYRLTMEVRRQREVIARLLRAIHEVEWLPGPDYARTKAMECPCCLQADYQGHAGDCLIGRALSATAPTATGETGKKEQER